MVLLIFQLSLLLNITEPLKILDYRHTYIIIPFNFKLNLYMVWYI